MKPGEENKSYLLHVLQTLFGEDEVVSEHRFHPVRMWRFDYAVPSIKLAIEYQGHAGFVKAGSSGHSTIKGLTNDSEKFNQAHAHGWRVLCFTALHFRLKERQKHKLQMPKDTIMQVIAAMQLQKENNDSERDHTVNDIGRLQKENLEMRKLIARAAITYEPMVAKAWLDSHPENVKDVAAAEEDSQPDQTACSPSPRSAFSMAELPTDSDK